MSEEKKNENNLKVSEEIKDLPFKTWRGCSQRVPKLSGEGKKNRHHKGPSPLSCQEPQSNHETQWFVEVYVV